MVKIYFPLAYVGGPALVWGRVIGFVGQWGDLFESAVKRDLG